MRLIYVKILSDFTMFDSLIILFFPFILSFACTFLLSNIFLSSTNNLKLQGTFSSRTKRKRIQLGAGSIVIFVGASISFCLIVVSGFVPSPMFLKALLLGVVLVAVGFWTDLFGSKSATLFLVKLVFSIILVALLQPHFMKNIGFSDFALGIVFTLGCIYLINALNLLERTAIVFSISFTLFGSILGVYTQDVILSAGNFCVMGSLIAFAYFNFSESRKINLGVAGEILIGLSIASQGLYLFGEVSHDYSNITPFVFLLFLYPLSDALQYFGSIAINKMFSKNIKARQIHELF